MTYKYILPQIFPYVYKDSPSEIIKWVSLILDTERKDVPQGSSFAVTVDNWDDTWNLWMSNATKNFVESKMNADHVWVEIPESGSGFGE